MSLIATRENITIDGNVKPEGGTSGFGCGLDETESVSDTPILPRPANLDKRGLVLSERFIKFVPSDRALTLLSKYPNAFLLLTLIASRVRRTTDPLGERQIGEACIGDWGSCGLTRQKYRSALKILRVHKFIEVLSNKKFNEKSTIKATTNGTVVRLISSEIWDVNLETTNHQTNHQPTISQPLTRMYKNEKEKPKSKLFSSDSVEIGLAELLFSKISAFIENPKPPDFQSWARQIDLMIRIDKRNAVDIRSTIEWLYSSGPIFWRKNILSTAKLREKWDRLRAELKTPAQFQPKIIDRRQRLPDGSLANGGEELF